MSERIAAPGRGWRGPAAAVAGRILVQPLRVPLLGTPGRAGLPFRRIRLPGPGSGLAAWYVPHPDARRGVVLCHGHNDNRCQVLPLVEPLHRAGYHVLLFDQRGHGASGGAICSFGGLECRDVLAALEALRDLAAIKECGVLGISMGGAAAILAAERDPRVRAVVSDCAFARLRPILDDRLAALLRLGDGPMRRLIYEAAERIAGASFVDLSPADALASYAPRPALIIHAADDRLVPAEHARELQAAGGDGAALWIVPGARHARSHRPDSRDYAERIVSFFDSALPAGAS
jgi:hypothetical protein